MNYLRKKPTFVAVVITLLLSLMACQNSQVTTDSTEKKVPSKEISIRSAHSNWIEENFQTQIVNIGLKKLGYQVEKPKEIDYSAIYISVANGDLDYSVVNYEKLHSKFFEQAGGKKKMERVGILTDNLVQGYQIDKKTADQYQITNLEQLKDPKIAKLFDSDGDGKANLVGCNPGWGCELVINHHLKAYGLEDTVEHNQGRYTALMADLITRYKQEKSVLYYAYNPHWISSILKVDEDVIWLEVPFTSLPEEQGSFTEKDTTVEGENRGFAIDRIRIFANKKFLANNLVAKRWFELVEIPDSDISAESLRLKNGEDSPEDIRRHAEEWVKSNQELFDGWLEEARKAASET